MIRFSLETLSKRCGNFRSSQSHIRADSKACREKAIRANAYLLTTGQSDSHRLSTAKGHRSFEAPAQRTRYINWKGNKRSAAYTCRRLQKTISSDSTFVCPQGGIRDCKHSRSLHNISRVSFRAITEPKMSEKHKLVLENFRNGQNFLHLPARAVWGFLTTPFTSRVKLPRSHSSWNYCSCFVTFVNNHYQRPRHSASEIISSDGRAFLSERKPKHELRAPRVVYNFSRPSSLHPCVSWVCFETSTVSSMQCRL